MTGCQELLSEAFKNIAYSGKRERFNANGVEPVPVRFDWTFVIVDIIVFIIILLIVSLIGSFLWDNSFAVLFKGINKSNWTNILGLFLFIKLML